jgi:hypothetical protein
VSSENTKDIELEVDDTGLFSSSKIDIDAKNIKGHYNALKKEISIRKEIVKAITLNSIFKDENLKEQTIDFISIDVEGAEIDVLKGMDLENYAPRIIVIETNTAEDKERIQTYLAKYAYVFGREVRANSYFVRNDVDLKKIQNIVVTCSIEKQMHPLGEEYTIADYSRGIFYFEGEKSELLLKTLSAELSSLKKLIEKRNEVILTQTGQVDKSKDQLEKQNTDLAKKNKELEDLGIELNNMIIQIEEKEDQIEKKHNEINVLTAKMKEVELLFKDSQLKIDQYEEQLNQYLVLLKQKDHLINQQEKIIKSKDQKLLLQEERISKIKSSLEKKEQKINQDAESLALKEIQIEKKEVQVEQAMVLQAQKDDLINQQVELLRLNAQKLIESENLLKWNEKLLKKKDRDLDQKINELAVFYNSYTYKIVRLILWPERLAKRKKK